MLNFLSGKKTYLVSGAGLVVVGLWLFGVIGTDIATQAMAALGFGGAIALRSAISKVE
ncbi:MAG: hypothetical protein HYY11_02970 [Candidatus Methylomirabilis oxyfera]|nr:hypothetical protein [Candidatus Methylomirabilis oxyfera]